MRRSIRLKEHTPNSVKKEVPRESYIRRTNGTLPQAEYVLSADENGFLFNPNFNKKKENKIYVMGDSFVECSFVDEGKRLTDNLNKHEKFGNFYVNGGYSGITTLQAYNNLLNKIVPLRPKSVIYILPSNDAYSLDLQGGYWNFDDSRFTPIMPSRNGDAIEGCFYNNLEQFKSLLEIFCNLSEAFGFDLTFCTTPYVQNNFTKLSWHILRYSKNENYVKLIEKRKVLNQILRNVAYQKKKGLIDLESIFAKQKYFYDDVHMNEKGCEILSRMILDRERETR